MKKLGWVLGSMLILVGLSQNANAQGSHSSDTTSYLDKGQIWLGGQLSVDGKFSDPGPDYSVALDCGYMISKKISIGINASYSRSYNMAQDPNTGETNQFIDEKFFVGPSINHFFRIADRFYYQGELQLDYFIESADAPTYSPFGPSYYKATTVTHALSVTYSPQLLFFFNNRIAANLILGYVSFEDNLNSQVADQPRVKSKDKYYTVSLFPSYTALGVIFKL